MQPDLRAADERQIADPLLAGFAPVAHERKVPEDPMPELAVGCREEESRHHRREVVTQSWPVGTTRLSTLFARRP